MVEIIVCLYQEPYVRHVPGTYNITWHVISVTFNATEMRRINREDYLTLASQRTLY